MFVRQIVAHILSEPPTYQKIKNLSGKDYVILEASVKKNLFNTKKGIMRISLERTEPCVNERMFDQFISRYPCCPYEQFALHCDILWLWTCLETFWHSFKVPLQRWKENYGNLLIKRETGANVVKSSRLRGSLFTSQRFTIVLGTQGLKLPCFSYKSTLGCTVYPTVLRTQSCSASVHITIAFHLRARFAFVAVGNPFLLL